MAGKTNRTTTREAKARELIATGAVSLLPGKGIALVAGSNGRVYTVGKVHGLPTCDCPDHQNRGVECKHMLATRLLCEEYRRVTAALAARQHGEKVRIPAALVQSLQTYYTAQQRTAGVA